MIRFFLALKDFIFGFATFVIERWRIFLPLAIAVAVLFYVYQLRGERDQAERSLAALSKYIADKTAERVAENTTKDAIAKSTLAAVALKHGQQLTKWRLEYDALQKKNGTAQQDLLAANASNALWRERVRLDTEAFTQRLRALPGAGQDLAGSGGDSDAAFIRRAYDNLEIACKITTEDYNALRLSWDSACLIYGCKK
ncbi:MAG TPA: hypothetical protein VK974_04635 [Methylophilaceae bacterium]|nr:hypothetical protein [Methylophilaceae bacterium]